MTRIVKLMSVVLLMSPAQALAQCYEFLPAWTHTASACSVDEDSLDKYEFSNADFTFKGDNTSQPGLFGYLPIVVRCNVVNPLDAGNPNWDTMIVGYHDPDGNAGSQYSVTARLRKVARSTGTNSTVATFSSQSYGATTRTENIVPVPGTFDFLNNEYYVQIELIRAATSTKPTAYMVRLANRACIN